MTLLRLSNRRVEKFQIVWIKSKRRRKVGRIELVSSPLYYTVVKSMSNLNSSHFFSEEQSDANNFTVAGQMQTKTSKTTNSPKLQFSKSDDKKSPPMIKFKSANVPQLGLSKSPSMMVTPTLQSTIAQREDRLGLLKRSTSVPGEDEDAENRNNLLHTKSTANMGFHLRHGDDEEKYTGSKVTIPKLDDDETFMKFFSKLQRTVIDEEERVLEISDFDQIVVSSERLTQKKSVQGPKGRRAAKNPLKALAARNDLQNEYIEIKTGVAEKELKRMKLEASKYEWTFFF
jgi:supervillin